jgi:hypothetical protein
MAAFVMKCRIMAREPVGKVSTGKTKKYMKGWH